MMKPSQYVLIFCVLLIWSNIGAQIPQHLTIRDGLPSNHVYEVQEDAQGFIWMATNRGLVKYNGASFRTFTLQDGLPNNDVWQLQPDKNGRLWFFSISNRHGYVLNDSIHSFPTSNGQSIKPTPFIEDDQGILLSNGTYRFTGSAFEVNQAQHQKTLLTSPEYLSVIDTMVSHYGYGQYSPHFPLNANIYVRSRGKVYFLDDKLHTEKVVDIPELDMHRISYHHGIFSNGVHVFTNYQTALFINPIEKTAKTVSIKDFNFKNSQPVINIKTKEVNGQWQLSFPGGLLVLDKNFQFIEKYVFPKSLETINAFRDSKGNVWASSLKNGVYLYTAAQNQARYFLKNKKVNLFGKAGSSLIAASEVDGIYHHEKNIDSFVPISYLSRNIGKPYQISTYGESWYLATMRAFIKNINGNFSTLNYPSMALTHSGSKSFLFKSDTLYRGTSHTFEINYGKEHKFNIRQGITKLANYQNTIYVGSTDGLHYYKDGTFNRPNFTDSLLLSSPITALVSKDSTLWAGTNGRGVYGINENSVHHLQATEGLSVQNIAPQNDTLWLATNVGLKKVVLDSDFSKSKITQSFYETDGLPQNNLNDIYVENNHIYLATDIGVSRIDPNLSVYKQKPELFFEHQVDTLIVKPEENRNLNISFYALSYGKTSQLKYRYRLLPKIEEWQTTLATTINISNLKPQHYTLEISAIDPQGNRALKSLTIIIQPKWFETTLTYIIFIVFGLLLIGLLIWLLINYFKQKERKRLATRQQIKRLELKALRSQMNPHFVHNSLNAIQYYIQRNEVELSENYLSKFSKLIRQFFEYSRQQTLSIKDEITLLDHYLQIEKLRFEDKISYKIEVDKKLDTEERHIPSMILQPLVENAVNHGLFHKKDEGSILISFKEEDKSTFKVTVLDDGIGIDKSKQLYRKSTKNYRSHSSAVLDERLRLLKEGKEWNIDYQIEDMSTRDTGKTGTRVTLLFKHT